MKKIIKKMMAESKADRAKADAKRTKAIKLLEEVKAEQAEAKETTVKKFNIKEFYANIEKTERVKGKMMEMSDGKKKAKLDKTRRQLKQETFNMLKDIDAEELCEISNNLNVVVNGSKKKKAKILAKLGKDWDNKYNGVKIVALETTEDVITARGILW